MRLQHKARVAVRGTVGFDDERHKAAFGELLVGGVDGGGGIERLELKEDRRRIGLRSGICHGDLTLWCRGRGRTASYQIDVVPGTPRTAPGTMLNCEFHNQKTGRGTQTNSVAVPQGNGRVFNAGSACMARRLDHVLGHIRARDEHGAVGGAQALHVPVTVLGKNACMSA